MVSFGSSTPIVRAADVTASLAYYRRALGFELHWQWSQEGFDRGAPTVGCVRRGDFHLIVSQHQGAFGTWVLVRLDSPRDVDALDVELRASGALALQHPRDEPWGARELKVEDPDGNVLRFSAPLAPDDPPPDAEITSP